MSDVTKTAAHRDSHDNGFVTDEPTENRPARVRSQMGIGQQTGASSGGLMRVEPLRKEQMQPTYAQDLGVGDIEHDCYGSMINCLGACFGTIGSVPCCICFPNPYKEVKQGSVGLVTRFGKFYKSVDPGLVKVNPFSESLRAVDVKIQVIPIPRQTALTKDNVNVQVDSVIYWHVTAPYKAAFGIADVRAALVERAQTTLRSVIGSRTLQNVVVERESIALEIEEILEAVSERWGIQVESILLKDLIFSVLSSPAAMQIRTLEAQQAMARSANTKIIFIPTSFQGMGSQAAMQLANLNANTT